MKTRLKIFLFVVTAWIWTGCAFKAAPTVATGPMTISDPSAGSGLPASSSSTTSDSAVASSSAATSGSATAPTPPPQGPLSGGSSPSFSFSASDRGVDLRSYFPSQYTVNISRNADGSIYSDYRFYESTSGLFESFINLYLSFFNLRKPGRLLVWEKRYGANHDTCIATYAQLFKGDDMSLTEVGDWYATDACHPNVALGYSDSKLENPDGLAWSGAGGLDTPQSVNKKRSSLKTDLGIAVQGTPGSPYQNLGPQRYRAWSETVVVETLATFTPAYGRGKDGTWGRGQGRAYSDVVRVILYHGTKQPDQASILCNNQDSSWDFARYYRHQPGYNSYASEFYMAPGRGIVQESFLYTESGAYWKMANCVGLSLDADHKKAVTTWTSYIDEK